MNIIFYLLFFFFSLFYLFFFFFYLFFFFFFFSLCIADASTNRSLNKSKQSLSIIFISNSHFKAEILGALY